VETILRKTLIKFFKGVGLYERVKYSKLYNLYRSVVDPKILKGVFIEKKFYKTFLRDLKQDDIIFDIGANVGDKTNIFLNLGAKVVAVEPEKYCQTILKNRFRKKQIILVDKAVSNSNGEEIMFIHEPGSGKNTLSSKWKDVLQHPIKTRFDIIIKFSEKRLVKTTTIDELIQSYGRPYYLKIDVEGYEYKVLQGLSIPLPNISFELNLPEFKEDGQRCLVHLNRLSSNWRINYVENYARGFIFPEWVSILYFLKYLQDYKGRYMEVFCSIRN
jgi:FkbM family methyltransferase